MALRGTGGGTLLPSFQARYLEALKAAGLVPMSTGITKPVPMSQSYSDVIRVASSEVERAGTMFGSRLTERYSTEIGNSYRDKRFAMIASLESIRLRAYQDTAKNVSVGLGFNMDKSGARDVWRRAFGNSISFDDVKAGKKELTMAQVKTLFDHDIAYYEQVVTKAAGNRALTENQRLALVSIAYNAPSRVASWASVIQSGDDVKLQELILTQSFNPNHSQANGLKARRYIEAQVFSGSGELKALMPTFNQYMAALEVDPQTGTAKVMGRAVSKEALEGTRLATLEYANQGAKRNLKVTGDLEREIQRSVTAVYGADYKVKIVSGGQGEGSNGMTGSRRHTTLTAADVYIYDPSGRRLSSAEMLPLAQDWLARDIGSVGLPVRGSTQSLHLDLIGGSTSGSSALGKKEGRFWFYGGEDKGIRELLNGALAGKRPDSYAISPEAVARGYVPPASIKIAATAPIPSSVEAKLIARAKAEWGAADTPSIMDLKAIEEMEKKKASQGALTPAEIKARNDALKDYVAKELAKPNAIDQFDATFSNLNPIAAGEMQVTPTGALAPREALEAIRAVPVMSLDQPITPTSLAGKTPMGTPIAQAGAMGVVASRPVVTQVSSSGSGTSATTSVVSMGGSKPMTAYQTFRSMGYSPSQADAAINYIASETAWNNGKYGNDGKRSYDPVTNTWRS